MIVIFLLAASLRATCEYHVVVVVVVIRSTALRISFSALVHLLNNVCSQ